MSIEKIRVVIVEDEPVIAKDLANQLRKAGMEILSIFEDGESVLAYLKNDVPDIILMDIQLCGDIDGVDVANQINNKHHIPIIFLTSNTDDITFSRARLTYPHAYLSKPFRITDILHSIELALENSQGESDPELEILKDRIFIRNKDSLEKVLFKNILYLKADGAYSKVITSEKEYIISQTLKKLELKIDASNMLKVHRSYIVNLHNIDKITDGYVYIKDEKIPVSRLHREELLRLFKTL